MYCCHCGSSNVSATDTGNSGVLFVGEEYEDGDEVFDGNVSYFVCNNCSGDFYASNDQASERRTQ